VTHRGFGPAWGNSLFEDNAEYGFGMAVTMRHRRAALKAYIEGPVLKGSKNVAAPLRQALEAWSKNWEDLRGSRKASDALKQAIAKDTTSDRGLIAELKQQEDIFAKKSQWILGGDGWAYDIGYGGLDHVLASGADVKLMVLDTEVYSNTGGQTSKATPRGGVAKFSTLGKPVAKKDLGMMAMTYGSVYVASVALTGNYKQVLQAVTEAESYPGPALIICYCPCIAHGIEGGMANCLRENEDAVKAGYWIQYRYDPRRKSKGLNPLILDSKADPAKVREFVRRETRFRSLWGIDAKVAKEREEGLVKDITDRYEMYLKLAAFK
jgi:pyruvate-ferredoxin/flavodoxin oxidoreductase